MGKCVVCLMYIDRDMFMELLKHQREDHYLDKYLSEELRKIEN